MFTSRTSRTVFFSLLGVLALATAADAQRPGSSGGRPAGGGGSRPSAPSVSRPSAPSVSRPSMGSSARPSSPSISRPAPASVSRPAASYQRPGASQAPAPQPRSQPAPAPRYEQPSAPRSQPTPQPRYEQPSTPRYAPPSTPRYEQPSTPRYDAPSAPRYEQPSGRTGGETPTNPRYGSSRDASGRVYDGSTGSDGPSSGRLDGASSRGDYRGAPPVDDSGRIQPARIDRSTPTPYQPRVWQPSPVVDLSGAVLPPRARVPALSGSRSGPDGGLAAGRLARAGLDGARANAAMPHPEVSADSLRARYGADGASKSGARAPAADARAESGARGAESQRERAAGISSGRERAAGHRSLPGGTPLGDSTDRVRGNARRTIDEQPGRGAGPTAPGSDFDRRAAAGMRTAGQVERADPEKGHRLRAAGKAAHGAGTVATGVVVGTCAGYYGGYWDPCGDVWDQCGWYWNSCWYGGWWWSWSFGWPYGSCWWGWPGYSYSCWPYWGGSSYWGWGWSPWIYSTVIYESEPQVVYVEQPAPAAEVAPAGDPGVGAPAPGPVPAVAPEVRAGLEASADEALLAGDTAFREGRYSDAVRHYARAVEFSPERGSLWLILSDALFATGDYHYAAYAFRRSLELDATLLETLVDKHGWYTDPAEFDRHVAWAEAYLRDHVLDEDARLILAANYLFAKRFASATDALESAFGAGLLETQAGKLVLERSRRALGLGPK